MSIGSFRKLKNEELELNVSLGFDVKGKRIRKFKTVPQKIKPKQNYYYQNM
ncbi:MAG: hypothetical protein ABF289_16040 [Clostridiales bacterium]